MIDVDGAAYPFYKTTTHTHLSQKMLFYEWKLGYFKTLTILKSWGISYCQNLGYVPMKGFYNFQIIPDDNLVPIRPLPIAIRKINVNIAAMQLSPL